MAEGQTTDVWRGHGVPYSCAQDQNRALARQRRDRLTGEEVGELAMGQKALGLEAASVGVWQR